VKDVELFLKQMDKLGMAISIRNQSEEIQQLRQDLQYEKARRELAEKTLLRELDKNIFQRIFG